MSILESFVVQVASMGVFLVAFVAALGYILDVPILYTWPKEKAPMSLPTALCFIVTSISTYILGGNRHRHYPNSSPKTFKKVYML